MLKMMQVKSVECSAEQRRLANFIKSVHRQLRQKVIASTRAIYVVLLIVYASA